MLIIIFNFIFFCIRLSLVSLLSVVCMCTIVNKVFIWKAMKRTPNTTTKREKIIFNLIFVHIVFMAAKAFCNGIRESIIFYMQTLQLSWLMTHSIVGLFNFSFQIFFSFFFLIEWNEYQEKGAQQSKSESRWKKWKEELVFDLPNTMRI